MFIGTHFVFVRFAGQMPALCASSSVCSSLRLRHLNLNQAVPAKQVCLPLLLLINNISRPLIPLHVFVHKVDLSQLKKLHSLQLDMWHKEDPSPMFRFITSMLSGITQNLRVVKIICDCTLLREEWDYDNLIQECHTLENALLEFKPGNPHIVFYVYPFMAKNRSLPAYELLTHCFSHLYKSGRLHVKFESPTTDPDWCMYDLFWCSFLREG